MVLTVSPAEAKAIQEDEVQLLMAIVQASRVATSILSRSQAPVPQQPETLAVQMGRRLVYGWMKDGQFRNELDANAIRVIFDAIQKPVSEGVDTTQYRGKIPAIEIREGDKVLFREERDGTITLNAVQLQIEQEVSQNHTQSRQGEQAAIAVDSGSAAPNATPKDWATEIAQTADYLLNPLGEVQPIYDSVSLGNYAIKRNNNAMTVSRGDDLILVVMSGKIINEQVKEMDWQAFQTVQNRLVSYVIQQDVWHSEPYLERAEEALLTQEYRDVYELWDDLERMTVSELVLVATQRFELYPDGIDTANLEDDLLKQYEVIQDILAAYRVKEGIAAPQNQDQVIATADIAEATVPQDTLPAIAIAERETAKLPEGDTKQLLQATVHEWQHQSTPGMSRTIQSSRNWLSSRIDHWRNQRMARTTINLFNRGYERTGERLYRVGEYTISRKERNSYVLKDTKGELLQFQFEKVSIFGINRQRFRMLAVSDRLSRTHLKDIHGMERDQAIVPQGELDLETNYAVKTRRAEQTVRQFLQTYAKATVWEKEGGRFKLEIGVDEFLQITDKQERGVIFQRQNGAVYSRLNAQDLAHFERLATKMQQAQQPLTQAKPELNGHAARKTPVLELE